MNKTLVLGLAGIGLASMLNTSAAPTPYADVGTANPTTYSFIATGSGDVTAYFVGETAGFGSVIGMSVNGGAPGSFVLQNHSHAYGDSALLGSVLAGDIITFVMLASKDPAGPPPVDYTWYSDATLNDGGLNHIYSSLYGGDAQIPAGTYVGFEDLPDLGDKDYDDHQFVFVGEFRGIETPDGGSTALLMGLASFGLVAIRNRRK